MYKNLVDTGVIWETIVIREDELNIVTRDVCVRWKLFISAGVRCDKFEILERRAVDVIDAICNHLRVKVAMRFC